MNKEINTRELMADTKFYEAYSRFLEKENRYETWEESVKRVMDMHRTKYAKELNESEELTKLLEKVEENYKNKNILGAQRGLQFGGDPILKKNEKIYNCASSYCDRTEFFGELFYMLLCGCGVGFSVQYHHIKKLPDIKERTDEAITFKIPDTIEGWADSINVLLSSFFVADQVNPEYFGKKVYFDYSLIRPKGSKISSGYLAPGHEGLRIALEKCEDLIIKILKEGHTKLRTIDAYDICMYISDAVLSGGIRRSACLTMFSKEDELMLKAKTGNWFIDNPQRGRSNNSVMLEKDKLTKSEFEELMKSVKEFGEPGFILTDDKEHSYNPCVEIGMLPKITIDGEEKSGFQVCNLTEINGGKSISEDIFYKQCETASILGTLQAGYTTFNYLTDISKKIIERESLIGVSITGYTNNPKILFNEKILQKGAKIVKDTNKKVAKLIGINQAARTTTTKPAGTTSILLGTGSGIHTEYSPKYIRNVQMQSNEEILKIIEKNNPKMVENSVWGNELKVISFPIISPEGSLYKKDYLGIKQLELVKIAQKNWIEPGTNIELCVDKRLRHNISNTISVVDWEEITDYIYENKKYFCGVSLLPATGDRIYNQAPFTEIKDEKQIIKEYGQKALFTSGLIEPGLKAFNNDLWAAINEAINDGKNLTDSHQDLEKRDFVRRFNKFSKNFNSTNKCGDCLKDVYLLHKWWKIQSNFKDINWEKEDMTIKYTDIDTMGATACAGGKCEI